MFVISIADYFCVCLAIYLTLLNPVNSHNKDEFGYAEVQDEPNNEFVVPISDHSDESLRVKRSVPDAQNAGNPQDQASLPTQPPAPGIRDNVHGQVDQDSKPQSMPDRQENFMDMNREKMQEAMINSWKSFNQKGAAVPDYLMKPRMPNGQFLNPPNLPVQAHAAANNEAVNNLQAGVNWNPNQPNYHNKHVPDVNGPQYNMQNFGPPLTVPPNYYQNIVEMYEQYEKFLMSQKNHIPNINGHKSRVAVPPEFLLEEVFFYPSLNLDLKGQISQLPLNNEFSMFTVLVRPGIKDCYFYTPLAHFRIDYQVIHGGGLDMGLFVKAPDGEPIAIRPPVPEASIVINVPPHFRFLSYAICLDNRKASHAEKQTYLSIDLELNWDNPDPYESKIIEFVQRKYNTKDPEMTTKVAEFAENINNVTLGAERLGIRLRRIEHLQQRSNNFALSDRALMEDNLDLVTKRSICQMVLMFVVAVLQVFLIRSLFNPDSHIYRVCSKKQTSTSGTC